MFLRSANRSSAKRACVRGTILIALAGMALAQQDLTAEWKASLLSLEQRLEAASEADSSLLEVWRTDAEALRESLVLFAASHPEMHLTLPESLPSKLAGPALRTQFEQLRAAVEEVIRR